MTENLCRRTGCQTPIPADRYLCTTCTIELDDMLRRVPNLIRDTNPHDIAIKSGLSGGVGSSTSSGSKPPFNLHQWSVWIELQGLPQRAHDVATRYTTAASVFTTTQRVVGQADQLLDGYVEHPIDIREARWRIHVEHPEHHTAAEIVELFSGWGVTITRPQLRKWVERGHLMSVGTAEDGRSSLFTVLGILTALGRTHQEVAKETTLV